MKVVTAEQMRQIDSQCAGIGLPTSVLMENAGKAVAEETGRILGSLDKQRILFLIGPGNNGGDGLVAARYLHDWGAEVSLYLCGQRPADDLNLGLVKERGIACVDGAHDESMGSLDGLLLSASTVVDALFGTGRSRPLRGIFPEVLGMVGKARKREPQLRVIAIDLPSGLDADTGAVDPNGIKADNTITLGFPKPGLFNFPGAEMAGEVVVTDIGIPPYLAEPVATELITGEWAQSALPGRPLGANKGSFGRVLVVAGSINYSGAAYLACSGAARVGAGLVTLATASSLQPVLAAKLTEVTYLPLPESRAGVVSARAAGLIRQHIDRYGVLLVGCGLGVSPAATELTKALLIRGRAVLPALVLDADALNVLSRVPRWWQQLTDDAILTPHPGEMARLCGASVDEVQADRLGTARRAAEEWHKTVVLKGAYTVVASPDGRVRISPVANPGLASAGTGDVLSGAIAGLMAQGLPPLAAACLGVYLHSKAGELVKAALGDAGMLASDLLTALPLVIKRLKEG